MQWDYDKVVSYISYESKSVIFACHADKADFEQDCLVKIYTEFKRKITVPYISVKWYIRKEIKKYFASLKAQRRLLSYNADITVGSTDTDEKDENNEKCLDYLLKTSKYDSCIKIVLTNQPHNRYIKTLYVNYSNYRKKRNQFDYEKRKALNVLKYNFSKNIGNYGI